MDKTTIEGLITERGSKLLAIAEKNRYKESLRKQIVEKYPDLAKELADIDAEYDTSELQKSVADLETSIKNGVLEVGQTVKVEGVGQAIFNGGRVTWKTDGLDGLMVAVPQLAQFRKVGDPYVTFR